MATLRRTFLPGIAGACIEQVNILISRLVAYWLVPSAVPLLYLAARLTELPNGVFGASITTVFFPNMAKIVGEGSKGKKAGETFLGCMVAMVWIMVPSAIGLFILRREILLVFFQHGDFTATDAIRVLPIIGIYCVGMVFSSLAALCVRGFHSFGDMKTPAFVGAAVLIANAILSLTLGGIYGVHGVATATTVATILQVLCLVASMEHRIPMPSLADRIGDCRTLLCGNVAVFLIAAATKHVVQSFYSLDSRTGAVLAIVFAASLSPLAYLVVSRKMLMGRFTASGAEHHGKPS
jgi:peptidoglycan biosynthesis protein MviN/MurJ (putative lipid II flippase)